MVLGDSANSKSTHITNCSRGIRNALHFFNAFIFVVTVLSW
nr:MULTISPECIES: DUF3265 domain-containing protein [unclassified Vibrio]